MTNRFDIVDVTPAELELRWILDGPHLDTRRLLFETLFDNVRCGKLSLNMIGVRTLVWNQFYPLAEEGEQPRTELQGKGLATLAQSIALIRTIPFLSDISATVIKDIAPTRSRQDMLKRMGNASSVGGQMPFNEYLDNSIAACRVIGFSL